MSARVLLFAQPARTSAFYTLGDDFLWGDSSVLWAGCLLEVIWQSYTPGELHAIELIDERLIARYVRRAELIDGELALEIHGGNAKACEPLPHRLVKRVGRVRRVFYVRDQVAMELPDHRALRL